MDKLDIEDVIKVVCEKISKNKRFSELSHLELFDLWKGLSDYLLEQLVLKKSINVSAIGSFHVKKTKTNAGDERYVYSVSFIPSKAWDKIPGLQIERSVPSGGMAAETLNLASVAQRTGFTRDLVEAGLKDIVHALFRILKHSCIVSLSFGNLGKLLFQSQDIMFRFSPGFIKAMNEERFESPSFHRVLNLNTGVSNNTAGIVASKVAGATGQNNAPASSNNTHLSTTQAAGAAGSANNSATLPTSGGNANPPAAQPQTQTQNASATATSTTAASSQQPQNQQQQSSAAVVPVVETRANAKNDQSEQKVQSEAAVAQPKHNATASVETPTLSDNKTDAKPDVSSTTKEPAHAEPSTQVAAKDVPVLSPPPTLVTDNEHNEKLVALKSEAVAALTSSTSTAMADLDEAARKLSKLEELIDKTFSIEARNVSTHTHSHSGDRLWKDQKCPICRTKKLLYSEDRELQKRAEHENDRMLLHLSLDLDKVFIQKKREAEAAKLKNAISTAHYNHLKSLERQQSYSKKESLPMGNLFENREAKRDPVMLQIALASGLKQQLDAKRAQIVSQRVEKDLEESINNERIAKDIRTAELQAHLDKLQRYKKQQEALSEQIRTHQSIKDGSNEPSFDNPFARSESLMALYQKEKAKQLYQEQLAIVRQRREYAHRVAEIEKRHSLERLALSRKELEKDLRSIKQGKVHSRKELESYWSDQVVWKQKLRSELESNC